MIALLKRNMKLYFRDRGSVFFSLLGVLVIFFLYIFFLGDNTMSGLQDLEGIDFLLQSWMFSGMVAAATLTTGLGAYGTMVEDKYYKKSKDFFASPLKRSQIAGGYMLSGLVVSILMSLITFVIGEGYIYFEGGELLEFEKMVEALGVILLSCVSSSAVVCFFTTMIKTMRTYSSVSIVAGTLVGFLVGAYIPVGNLPDYVQNIIKAVPCAHSAALLRQIMMEKPISITFTGAPTELITETKEQLGVLFTYGSYTASPLFHIMVLVITSIVFYGLSIIMTLHGSKQK